jgi:hypothetical protein
MAVLFIFIGGFLLAMEPLIVVNRPEPWVVTWLAMSLAVIASGAASLFGLWYSKGRLVYRDSEVTIYSLNLTAGVSSRYSIEDTSFGDGNVKFRVRRWSSPSYYNVRFSPEEFERFKRLAAERRPSTLSWEYG